jgi:hypothetical protein
MTLAAALAVAFAACSGGDDGPEASGARVHVAGQDGGRATLWPTGSAKRLGDGPSHALSVVVAGGDVYVAGVEGADAGSYRATLWTNGSARRLGDGPSVAYSVSVSPGGDVYVAGIEYEGDGEAMCATLWTNGSARRLGDYGSAALSVSASGGDICVAGTAEDPASGPSAVLWRNGGAEWLAGGPSDVWSEAHSVCAAGGKVYVAGMGIGLESDPYGGYEVYRATLWEDGVAKRLSEDALALAVFASGGDVHVAGSAVNPPYGSSATIWTNGAPRTLGDDHSYAASVFVSGADVYAAGYVYDAQGRIRATIWENGAAKRLSDGDSSAHSVFVK